MSAVRCAIWRVGAIMRDPVATHIGYVYERAPITWFQLGKCCDIDCNYDCLRGALRLTQCRVASPLDAPCAVEVIRRLDQLEHLCQLANLQHRIEAQAEHPTFWRSALRGMTRYLV